jgi:hypothetical protein
MSKEQHQGGVTAAVYHLGFLLGVLCLLFSFLFDFLLEQLGIKWIHENAHLLNQDVVLANIET